MDPTIEYEFDFRPEPGSALPITDGIHWLRMPLPFILGHINLWLLRDSDGWTVVDTGLYEANTREIWSRLLETFSPLQRVIVTHLHPDHSGCAGWLCRQQQVELWMSRTEYLLGRILKMDTGRPAPDAAVRFYRRAGFDATQLERFRKRFGRFGTVVSDAPDNFRRLEHGDELRIGDHSWTVLVGRGHSPEHATLYCQQLNCLISGDQILPTISSNVSVWPTEPEANPLQDWFNSLRDFREWLPEDVLVLPAHGKPFRGAHIRLGQLINEHQAGLAALLERAAKPQRAVDVFPALFKGEIDANNLIMATGESVAHINYLLARGSLSADQDPDGVMWVTAS